MMTIKSFKIVGQHPNFQVHTVVDVQGESRELNLGKWEYVSTLKENDLLNLIAQTYQDVRAPELTASMKNLQGHSLNPDHTNRSGV